MAISMEHIRHVGHALPDIRTSGGQVPLLLCRVMKIHPVMTRTTIVLLALAGWGCAGASSATRCPQTGPGAAESGAPAAVHDHAGDHAHPHPGHGTPVPGAAAPVVISHAGIKSFENNGNTLWGLATASMGAQSFEVWRTSIAVDSRTPPHTHQSEEVLVILRGKGQARIGDQVIEFEAPATLIAPAGMQHQIINTGTEPTDAFVVVGIGSTIWTPEGKAMDLPWRH